MGLILTGAILVLFYIAKIFFPEWIVGVAEIPNIVKFGNYVDSHKWAHHLYNFSFGYFIGYIYCGACCRNYRLGYKGHIAIFVSTLLLRIISTFANGFYNSINYLNLVFTPFMVCVLNKNTSKETFVSTIVCFSVDILSQVLSLGIRNISLMATSINSATFTILLIDVVIWRVLLYLYFNYKKEA